MEWSIGQQELTSNENKEIIPVETAFVPGDFAALLTRDGFRLESLGEVCGVNADFHSSLLGLLGLGR